MSGRQPPPPLLLAFLLAAMICGVVQSEEVAEMKRGWTCPSACRCSRLVPEAPSAGVKLSVSCSGLDALTAEAPLFDSDTAALVQRLDLSGSRIRSIPSHSGLDRLVNVREVNFGSTPLDCRCSKSVASLHSLARKRGSSVSVLCSHSAGPRQLKSLSLEDLGCVPLSWEHGPPPSSAAVDSGSEITLKCQARGKPSAEVTWILDGRPVVPSATVSLKRHGRLHLSNAQLSDQGVYTCHISNHVSSLRARVELAVRGRRGTVAEENAEVAAGVNGGEVTVERIAGGVESLKNQLQAAFDRINELDMQLSTLADGTPTVPVATDFSTSQEARIEQLVQAAIVRHVEPLQMQVTELTQEQEMLRRLVTSQDSDGERVEGDTPAATSGQSSATEVESRLAVLESQVSSLADADLNTRQRTSVQTLVIGLFGRVSTQLSSMTRDVSGLKRDIVALQAGSSSGSDGDLTRRVQALETNQANISSQVSALSTQTGLPRQQQLAVERSILTGLQPLSTALTLLRQDLDENVDENKRSFLRLISDSAAYSSELDVVSTKVSILEAVLNSTHLVSPQRGDTTSRTLQTRVQTLADEVAELKDQSTSLNTTTTGLTKRLQFFFQALIPLQQSTNRNSAQVGALDKTLRQQQTSLNSVLASHVRLNETVRANYDELKKARPSPAVSDSDSAAVQDLESSLQTLTTRVSTGQRNLQRDVASLGSRLTALSDQEGQLSRGEESRVTSLITSRLASLPISSIQSSIQDARRQTSSLTNDVRAVQQSVRGVQTVQSSLRTTVSDNYRRLSGRVAALEAQGPTSVDSEIAGIEATDLTNLRREFTSLTSTVTALTMSVEDDVADMRRTMANITMQGQALTTGQRLGVTALIADKVPGLPTIISLQRSLNTSRRETQSASAQLGSVEKQLSDLESTLTRLEAELPEKVSRTQYVVLQSTQRATATALVGMARRLATVERSQAQGEASPASPGVGGVDSQALQGLRSQLAALSEQLATLTESLADQVNSVAVRQSNFTSQLIAVQQRVGAIRQLHSSDKSTTDVQLSELETRLNAFNIVGSAPVDSRLKALERSEDILKQADQRLSSQVTTVNDQVASLSRLLSAVRRTYDRSFADLRRRMGTVEGGVRTVRALQTRLISAERRLSTVASSVQRLQGGVDGLEMTVTNVVEDVERHNSTVTSLTATSQATRREVNQIRSTSARLAQQQTQQVSLVDDISAQLQGRINRSIAAAAAQLQSISDQRGSSIQQELNGFYQLIQGNNDMQLGTFRDELSEAMDSLRVERQAALGSLSPLNKCKGLVKRDTKSWSMLPVDGVSSGSLVQVPYAQASEGGNTTLEFHLSSTVTVDTNARLELTANGQPCSPTVSGLHTTIRSRRPVGIALMGICSVDSPVTGIHSIALLLVATEGSTGSLQDTQLTIKEYC